MAEKKPPNCGGFFAFRESEMESTVYVIESSEEYRYTGMTEDMALRLRQHNDHTLSFWTKRGTNWKLVYSKCFRNKSDALRREAWLKSGVGREYLKQIFRKV